MQLTQYITANSLNRTQKRHSAILPEKFAIVLCGLLVSVFAIPLLVVIQALSALFWGIATVFHLLSGKGLFNEEDEL
jgi:glucose uptake protein GlcU